jgi:hypothetical protein
MPMTRHAPCIPQMGKRQAFSVGFAGDANADSRHVSRLLGFGGTISDRRMSWTALKDLEAQQPR